MYVDDTVIYYSDRTSIQFQILGSINFRLSIKLEQDALQLLVGGDMSGVVRVPMPYCSTRARHEAIRDYDVCHF